MNPQQPVPQTGALPIELLPPRSLIIAVEVGQKSESRSRRRPRLWVEGETPALQNLRRDRGAGQRERLSATYADVFEAHGA